MKLPPDEILREMSKMAMQQAGEFFAEMADRFAAEMKEAPPVSGSEALTAFAKAIRSMNAQQFPPSGRSQ